MQIVSLRRRTPISLHPFAHARSVSEECDAEEKGTRSAVEEPVGETGPEGSYDHDEDEADVVEEEAEGDPHDDPEEAKDVARELERAQLPPENAKEEKEEDEELIAGASGADGDGVAAIREFRCRQVRHAAFWQQKEYLLGSVEKLCYEKPVVDALEGIEREKYKGKNSTEPKQKPIFPYNRRGKKDENGRDGGEEHKAIEQHGEHACACRGRFGAREDHEE